MGKYKFRLSGMVNALFYKLRHMGMRRKKASSSTKFYSHGRNMSTELFDHHRKTIYISSSTVLSKKDASFPTRYGSVPTYSPDNSFSSDESLLFWSKEEKNLCITCQCRENLACMCLDSSCREERRKPDPFHGFSSVELRPIMTKPQAILRKKTRMGSNIRSSSPEYEEVRRRSPLSEKNYATAPRRSVLSSSGIRLRSNSSRISTRKVHRGIRKNLWSVGSGSKSFVMLKSSADPQEDFQKSMIEMIVENNIRKPKELLDLLICYLSLNSNEYHGFIVKAFEQSCLTIFKFACT